MQGGISEAIHVCKRCGVLCYVGVPKNGKAVNAWGLPNLVVRHSAAPGQETCGKRPIPILVRPEKRRHGRATPRRPVKRAGFADGVVLLGVVVLVWLWLLVLVLTFSAWCQRQGGDRRQPRPEPLPGVKFAGACK